MTNPISDGVNRADASAKNFIQGEVLPIQDASIKLIDASWPLTPAAELEAEGADGPLLISEPVDHVVVVTQTCDLQRTSKRLPHCQVAPVVRVDSQTAKMAAAGRIIGLGALPWFADDVVADFARITTLERSLLVGVQSVGHPTSDRERAIFSNALGRHFDRVALPDEVSEILRPLLERMKSKSGKASPEGQVLDRVASIRVEANPSFDAVQPRWRVLFVVETTHSPTVAESDLDMSEIDRMVGDGSLSRISDAAVKALRTDDPVSCREGWTACAEIWLKKSMVLADSSSSVDSLDFEVLNGSELTFERVRNAPELDLSYLTVGGKSGT